MREILFRAKRVDTGEWAQGWFYEDETGIPMIGPKDGVGSYAVVDRDTLGQFTGSFDINGNRIWEGDIIRLDSMLGDGKQFEVPAVCDEGCFLARGSGLLAHIINPEVIGTIYGRKGKDEREN